MLMIYHGGRYQQRQIRHDGEEVAVLAVAGVVAVLVQLDGEEAAEQ